MGLSIQVTLYSPILALRAIWPIMQSLVLAFSAQPLDLLSCTCWLGEMIEIIEIMMSLSFNIYISEAYSTNYVWHSHIYCKGLTLFCKSADYGQLHSGAESSWLNHRDTRVVSIVWEIWLESRVQLIHIVSMRRLRCAGYSTLTGIWVIIIVLVIEQISSWLQGWWIVDCT